jgi:hypothetical protein
MPLQTVTSSANNFVSPFIAVLDASGSATLTQVALAQKVVSIAGIDETFAVSLSDAEAIALLNAFTISGAGADLAVAVTDALVSPLTSAINEARASNMSIAAWLNSKLNEDLVVHILSTLKVSVDVSSSVVVDAASGANNMKTGLAASSDVAESLYLQIPQATLNLYKEATAPFNPTVGALPVKKGDVLNFVFDVAAFTITAAVTSSTSNASNAGPSNANPNNVVDGAPGATDSAPSAPYEFDSQTLEYSNTPYRVCVAITLGAGSGAFTGLKAFSSI